MTGPMDLKLYLVSESSLGILYRELKFIQKQLKKISDLVVSSLAYLFLLEPQWILTVNGQEWSAWVDFLPI